MAASSLVVSMIISSALLISDRSMTAQAIYTAQFRAAAEISPGGDAAAGLPGTNTWCHDSRVFMEVTIPCFTREEVELESDVRPGAWVPVLTFTTASSWMLIQGEFERRREGTTINDRKYALSGKIYCADSGEKYSRCAGTEKYPDAVWRCRKKHCGRTVKEDDLKKAVITAFNRMPELREELIRMQERLQWGQMDRLSEEIAAVDARKAELENTISEYASSGVLDKHMIYLYGDGTENVEAVIEGIRMEMENLACMKMELLTQKGELAMREAQIHSLLRLTEAIEKRETASNQNAEEEARPDPSCTTLEDFYRRTDDIYVRGRIRKYDKQLVRRFIERVEVKPESLVIYFKAGVSVEVAG